ncbi:hypothetical protein S245_008982 [Arachis hypogaea]
MGMCFLFSISRFLISVTNILFSRLWAIYSSKKYIGKTDEAGFELVRVFSVFGEENFWLSKNWWLQRLLSYQNPLTKQST